MNPDPDLKDVLAGIARGAMAELERTGEPAALELRARLEQLVQDQAMVAAMALTGADTRVAQEAIEARLKGLHAAGLVLTAGQIQGAIRNAILSTIQTVFLNLPALV